MVHVAITDPPCPLIDNQETPDEQTLATQRFSMIHAKPCPQGIHHMSRKRVPARPKDVDHRTRESRLLQTIRNSLLSHVGGNPSATQMLMIDRCAALSLRVQLLDARLLADPAKQTEADALAYSQATTTLDKMLRSLVRETTKPRAQIATSDSFILGRCA
jgi:hypothetical protein